MDTIQEEDNEECTGIVAYKLFGGTIFTMGSEIDHEHVW